MTDGLRIEQDGAVLRITIDRPESLNSVSAPLLARATDAVQAAGKDDSVRVVVLTGTGRAFSSGADLSPAAPEDDSPGSPDIGIVTLDRGNDLVAAIAACPKPVVAAVNGLAAGIGATIALACDLVIARRRSYLLLAFVNIGLMPDGGATALVPAAVGRARAARMSMLGERIDADTALAWGLISHVVDDEQFDTEVEAVLARLARGATAAIAATKAALRDTTLGMLRHAHETERAGQLELLAAADFAEGRAAFLAKRPAEFTGH